MPADQQPGRERSPRQRMTRDSWVKAALRALLQSGPAAIAVEPLAVSMGTTKGSFYWHFSDRAELLEAALDRWQELATTEVIERVEREGGPPRARLLALLDIVLSQSATTPGELRLLGGVEDDQISAAVATVTHRRISYLEQLLCSAGLPQQESARRAVVAYATYLGYAQLARTVPGVLPARPAGHSALVSTLVSTLLD